jgi:predicted AlkP superfamily phosphohydrolase/phosphomutase
MRVLVVGLDALDAILVDRWLPELPNLRAICARGLYGPLESIVQPVTPVAWTSIATGRNPGHYGFTDFLYRPAPEQGYGPLRLVHSGLVRATTLVQRAAAAGLRTITIGLPVSYPPIEVPGGICVSCFMAPSLERGIVAPRDLQEELLAATTSPYLLDVPVLERDVPDRTELAGRLLAFDAQRFDLAHHLSGREWDLLFLVCMGTDRVGHYFMRFADDEHMRHEPDSPFAETILEHYRFCDRRLGELVEEAGPDTAVVVLSDHGMQRLDGRINLNEWLRRQGYLRLLEEPSGPTPFRELAIDWNRTRAWSSGYGGQIFFNVRGREVQGCVEESEVEDLEAELTAALAEVCGPAGDRLRVEMFRGDTLYDGPFADRCPDLCLQFDGLRVLTSSAVGAAQVVEPVTALGPDDGAHARFGFLALAAPDVAPLGRFDAMHLLDVAPTVLGLLGVDAEQLEGRPLTEVAESLSDEDELELTNRLERLYLT